MSRRILFLGSVSQLEKDVDFAFVCLSVNNFDFDLALGVLNFFWIYGL